MPTANRIVLMGTVSRQPTFANINGVDVCNFCIVINRKYKHQGVYQTETSYIDCQAWHKTAGYLAETKTGCELYVEGRVKQRKWVDKATGQNKSNLIVVAERVQYL